MDERHRRLKEDGDKLFADIRSLHTLWQDIAEQFYPSMADITNQRSLGTDYAADLTTSYPIIARRTLGDSISAMLRPAALDTNSPGVWFSMTTPGRDQIDKRGDRRWLDWATGVQREAMYDRVAQFTRATKEGDHNFVTFGHTPLSVSLNRNKDALIYRCWHVRDVVWSEDEEGQIYQVHRKWACTVSQAIGAFGDKCSEKIKTTVKENPQAPCELRHIMIRADKYTERDMQGKRWALPWVSIWIDINNDALIEEVNQRNRYYIIPRWMTLPQTQYAYSAAVVAALPDARLIQAMTLTLLEAGERYADPPMVGVGEAIRSDVQLYAGGFTSVDYEYDERLGSVLRPAYDVKSGEGLRYGIEMNDRILSAINKAFYLDSLSLPPADVRDMTAFETAQRISEWIRRALPIFEPIEFDYNGQVCEETFDILLYAGAFGGIMDMPQTLRGEDINFKFESPLHESADRREGQKFLEAKALLAEAAEIDPEVVPMLNARTALRDSLNGIGAIKWTRSEDEVDEAARQRRDEVAVNQAIAQVAGGSEVAKNLGSAAKDFAQAQDVTMENAA